MPKKKKAPQTFNEFLGAEIKSRLDKRGQGYDDLVDNLQWSVSTVGRKMRGETGLTVNELLEISGYLNVPSSEIVEVALRDFGGMGKLMSVPADISDDISVKRRQKDAESMTTERLEGDVLNAATRDFEMDSDEPDPT